MTVAISPQAEAQDERSPAPAAATSGAGRPLAVYLVIFGLAIALPALLFSGYLLYRFAEVERATAARIAQDSASALRDIVDRELAAMATTLRVLSTSGYLRTNDLAAFHERASAALEGSGNYVIVADHSGRQLLNTRVPYGTPLGPISDAATIEETLRGGARYVSDLFSGTVAREYVFNVALPVEVADGEPLILVMTRSARSLQPMLRQAKLDPGWSGTLIDRNGLVVAATGEAETGSPAPFLAAGPLEESSLATVTFDSPGGEMVLAVRRSFESGWRTVASAPAAAIEAPIRHSLMLLLLAGLALLVLTVLLAVVLGRIVSRPLLRLAGQARALGHGGTVAPLASPVREVNEVSRMLSAASAERKSAEDQVRFLMRELSHRAKNQLAVVVAMARRTAENSRNMAEFEKVFSERLMALARSTDLLVHQNWRGVALNGLVEAHLEPFAGDKGGRLHISGPLIEIGPEAAQSIGLALHELATNAAKYGALSVPEGRVTVSWRFAGAAGELLRLEWKESGGPPVEDPTRTGFGSLVIQRTVAQSLNGEVVHDFRPEGVFWAIDLPVETILRRA
jgi:two-component sensor histidine kinase